MRVSGHARVCVCVFLLNPSGESWNTALAMKTKGSESIPHCRPSSMKPSPDRPRRVFVTPTHVLHPEYQSPQWRLTRFKTSLVPFAIKALKGELSGA